MAPTNTTTSSSSPNSASSEAELVVVDVSGTHDTYGDTSSDVNSSESSPESSYSEASDAAGSAEEAEGESSSKVTSYSVQGTPDRERLRSVNHSSGLIIVPILLKCLYQSGIERAYCGFGT